VEKRFKPPNQKVDFQEEVVIKIAAFLAKAGKTLTS
jgi:hypothetical protein